MKKFSRRKGFTLVELTIIFAVISVLAAAMMLSSTEAVVTAKAAKIISDMNLIKRATMSWYMENRKLLKFAGGTSGYKVNGNTELHEYLKENSDELKDYFSGNALAINTGPGNYQDTKNNNKYYAPLGGYAVYMGKSNTVCYVVYKISENNKASEETRLKEKLQAKAKQAGLISYKYAGGLKSTATEYNGVDANVFMEVFKLDEYAGDKAQ